MDKLEFPDNYYYSKEHEWMSNLSGTVTIGVSAFAVDQLGDIVHIDIPHQVGQSFEAGDAFGTIESTKTVSDLYMPAAGKITEINQGLLESPETLAEDPYDKGWLVKIKLDEKAQGLMDSEAYQEYLSQEG